MLTVDSSSENATLSLESGIELAGEVSAAATEFAGEAFQEFESLFGETRGNVTEFATNALCPRNSSDLSTVRRFACTYKPVDWSSNLGGSNFFSEGIGGPFGATSYGEDGFEVALPRNRAGAHLVLREMQKTFSDRATRALAFDINLYNVDDDMFIVVQVVFYISVTGHIEPFTRMQAMRPMRELFFADDDLSLYVVAVFFAWQAFLFTREIKEVAEQGARRYILQVWNVVELVSFVLLGVLVYSVFEYKDECDELLKQQLDQPDNAYMETVAMDPETFEEVTIVDYEDSLNLFPLRKKYLYMKRYFAFICFLSVLKCFKYFRLHRSLNILWRVLELSGQQITSFIIILALLGLAFAQLGVHAFGYHTRTFHSTPQAITTMLHLAMGDLFYGNAYPEMLAVHQFIASAYLVCFMVVMILVSLNMFVALLGSGYENATKEVKHYQEVKQQVADSLENERDLQNPPAKPGSLADFFMELYRMACPQFQIVADFSHDPNYAVDAKQSFPELRQVAEGAEVHLLYRVAKTAHLSDVRDLGNRARAYAESDNTPIGMTPVHLDMDGAELQDDPHYFGQTRSAHPFTEKKKKAPQVNGKFHPSGRYEVVLGQGANEEAVKWRWEEGPERKVRVPRETSCLRRKKYKTELARDVTKTFTYPNKVTVRRKESEKGPENGPEIGKKIEYTLGKEVEKSFTEGEKSQIEIEDDEIQKKFKQRGQGMIQLGQRDIHDKHKFDEFDDNAYLHHEFAVHGSWKPRPSTACLAHKEHHSQPWKKEGEEVDPPVFENRFAPEPPVDVFVSRCDNPITCCYHKCCTGKEHSSCLWGKLCCRSCCYLCNLCRHPLDHETALNLHGFYPGTPAYKHYLSHQRRDRRCCCRFCQALRLLGGRCFGWIHVSQWVHRQLVKDDVDFFKEYLREMDATVLDGVKNSYDLKEIHEAFTDFLADETATKLSTFTARFKIWLETRDAATAGGWNGPCIKACLCCRHVPPRKFKQNMDQPRYFNGFTYCCRGESQCSCKRSIKSVMSENLAEIISGKEYSHAVVSMTTVDEDVEEADAVEDRLTDRMQSGRKNEGGEDAAGTTNEWAKVPRKFQPGHRPLHAPPVVHLRIAPKYGTEITLSSKLLDYLQDGDHLVIKEPSPAYDESMVVEFKEHRNLAFIDAMDEGMKTADGHQQTRFVLTHKLAVFKVKRIAASNMLQSEVRLSPPVCPRPRMGSALPVMCWPQIGRLSHRPFLLCVAGDDETEDQKIDGAGL
eukprot:SAG11_NODE_139_length_15111_cov_9.482214_7_plen_1248_part_00